MSIDISWDKLNEDNVLNESIRDFLNDQVQGLQLPDYLMNIKVTNFSLGSIAPEITIRHIGDPFTDFYNDEMTGSEKLFTENGSDIKSPMPSDSMNENDDGNDDVSNDIQFIVEVDYKGDITIEISVDLLLNYPSPGFITLPVKLRVVDLGIHSLAVIAHVSKVVYLSFLCDINDEQFDDIINNPTLSKHNRNRIDIIRSMRIESEIGDNKGEGSVLRNVGKVEKFLTDMIRTLLRDELAWPGWISFDFNEDDDEEEEEDGSSEHLHMDQNSDRN
ncbi:hypothetical protein WICANDRAFT_27920 [Wickerhamomyces anomalus NRRL Y-366-8]|uniref:Mitochondrial distribution and morphology protein 12 n=1 Tax=Wickerhamomyces anomalus (strain ATCC 58044 / CBS 1984 / NCYC 433 / NRRL Y-366-8) TaxID=683960 RepID=A0A1E3P6X8_WICAA|nr:uncharacterized protein WICANDRAFT_27920 [Wickerhamomyces anomalus NRRL Y-366-8]ODQ61176.1 hypothetical protein WICANDRAFT_27920 [Wickerhamomyces anomalus NRRL Y-366-8]